MLAPTGRGLDQPASSRNRYKSSYVDVDCLNGSRGVIFPGSYRTGDSTWDPDQPPRHLKKFLESVHWLSLEELGKQTGLDPLASLLTLPVLPKPKIRGATQQILPPRPDLLENVVSILGERFPLLTREEIMALINISTDHLRHNRFAQDWIAEGRLEGEARGEATLALRQLNLVSGPLSEAVTARIQALPLEQLEALTKALLHFSGPADLQRWLAEHTG